MAARAARIGAIRADSSATASSNWRCCSVFAETGNSVLLDRYGEISAVPEALRGTVLGDNGDTALFMASLEDCLCRGLCSGGGTGTALDRDEDDNCARGLTGDSIDESEGSSELDSTALGFLETCGVYSLPPFWEGVVNPENKRDNSGPNSFSPMCGCLAPEDWIWEFGCDCMTPFVRTTLDPFKP
jgi:hypothetical protein